MFDRTQSGSRSRPSASSPVRLIPSATRAVALVWLAGKMVDHVIATPVEATGESAMQRRQMDLSESSVLKIGGKAPLDPILLIAAAMAFSACCLVLAIVNVRRSRTSDSRLTNERMRAMSELRVRGGKASGGGASPVSGSSNGHHGRFNERKPRGPIDSTLSTTTTHTVDSKSNLLPATAPRSPLAPMYQRPSEKIQGPRLANNRSSRASRGYSFYRKSNLGGGGFSVYGDIEQGAGRAQPQRRPQMQHSMGSSMAQVPILPGAQQLDTSSETSSAYESPISQTADYSSYPLAPAGSRRPPSQLSKKSSGTSNMMGPRPLPSHARPRAYTSQSYSGGARAQHNRISSTTVGRGTNMRRKVGSNPSAKDLPIAPQSIDPAAQSGSGPSPDRGTSRNMMSNTRYPDLYRANSDNVYDSVHSSRRNSFSGSPTPNRRSSWFDGSGSDSHSHDHTGPSNYHPLQVRTSQLPRTRPLGVYDLEFDQENSPINQQTGLLNSTQAIKDSRQSWRAYN